MKNCINRMVATLLLVVLIFSSLCLGASAATVLKNVKTYEIAVAFDNSGSMYDNQAWCRAKYAMEIFAAMLNYENGDVLKIFPMWAVTTDGSKPANGGSYAGIEIKSSEDIDKISKLYTVAPSNTPFAPVKEAYASLRSSNATEKWLIVLTDGVFNQEERGQMSKVKLQDRLLELASEDIKVQYLGIGGAQSLAADESKFFYSKKSSDTSLKEDLVEICNTIFQRAVLPSKYISGQKLNVDLSMKNIIVFAQGSGARIKGLKNSRGESVQITLDSGQRKYSTISAGGSYSNAPVDDTLAGQVVTFAACPKGEYTLDCSGAEAVQIFYEPDVDIQLSLKNAEGHEVDVTEGSVESGEYSVHYGLVDSVTGEDVTKADLMGDDVALEARVVTSDGEEKTVRDGEKITLEPDDDTSIIVEGTYLKDYTISTKDDPEAFPSFVVELPALEKLKIKAEVLQESSWYQLGKEKEWMPIRVDVEYDGTPLTDEQLAATVLGLEFSKDIVASYKMLPGESAFEIYPGFNGNGEFVGPNTGKYNLKITATMTDQYGQQISDKDKVDFKVKSYGSFWRWLIWLIILAALAILAAIILNQKAWPKQISFVVGNYRTDLTRGSSVDLMGSGGRKLMSLELEKASKLYQRSSRQAAVYVKSVKPTFDVASFQIEGCPEYTKEGQGFVDSAGKPFDGTKLRGDTRVKVTFKSERADVDGQIKINSNN